MSGRELVLWALVASTTLGCAKDAKEQAAPPTEPIRVHHRDQVGVYDPATSSFFLRTAAGATLQFGFGPPRMVPVAGDWDGDGISTGGVYDPAQGAFMATNRHESGAGGRDHRGSMPVHARESNGGGNRGVADWNIASARGRLVS